MRMTMAMAMAMHVVHRICTCSSHFIETIFLFFITFCTSIRVCSRTLDMDSLACVSVWMDRFNRYCVSVNDFELNKKKDTKRKLLDVEQHDFSCEFQRCEWPTSNKWRATTRSALTEQWNGWGQSKWPHQPGLMNIISLPIYWTASKRHKSISMHRFQTTNTIWSVSFFFSCVRQKLCLPFKFNNTNGRIWKF